MVDLGIMRVEIQSAEAAAIADILEQLLKEDIAISDEVTIAPLLPGRSGGLSDHIVLTATVLQGAAAGLFLLDRLSLRDRAASALMRIQNILRFGGSTILSISNGPALDLSSSTADQLVDSLVIASQAEAGETIPPTSPGIDKAGTDV
jgi:hypothetical protein